MGLRSKILLLLFVLLVVPLSILGSGGYWLLKNKFHADALEDQYAITSRISTSAQFELSRNQAYVDLLAGSSALMLSLQRYTDAPAAASASAINAVLEESLALNFDIVAAAAYDRDGLLIEASQVRTAQYQDVFPFKKTFDASAWKAKQLSYQLLEVMDNSSLFLVMRPIAGPDNQVLGYLGLHISTLALTRAIEGRLLANMQLFYCDDAGKILAQSQPLAFDQVPADAMEQLATAAPEAKFVELTLEGKTYQLTLQPVGVSIWLGSLVDIEKRLQNIRRIISTALVVTAILVTLVSFFLYFQLARMVIRPLDHLNRATRKISAGEYLPDIAITSSDEIGELAASFRTMGSRLKESNDRVTQLAFFDPLTKLPNRETLRRSLAQMIEVAARNNSLLSVLFIDLDDFKKVNDRLGHAAGDQLLVVIGERLSDSLRSGDLVVGSPDRETDEGGLMISRRGGDEFNAILNNLKSARDIALIAERLITDINEPVILDDSPVSVGASIGIAIYPFDGADADTLLRNADLAMYEAKSLGKNKYYLFTEAINSQVHERLELEQRIASGLKRSEFELYFQPKITLASRSIAGFEALIRWRDPASGLVSPVDFIPLAEESQLIHDIGRWVIAEAFHHIREWDEMLPASIRIAINVSARQMVQESFAENFISLASQFRIPLSRLEIELTETSILTDELLVKRHLQKLRAVGVKISLDDFGTGYSSLTFLRNLPIDAVKIDRSFTAQLGSNSQSTAIVASLLDLCRRLSLTTVAEGIETQAQLDYLTAQGCGEGQGYYFAKPMPAEEMLEFLRSPEYLSM
ncbi:EAL domain-containing protein [Pseudomaricurvus alcaniphilus]|uniref:bifunctional diguanylate cyclase/phosphodiesterase n=1 Tax=Pseudomaricurvus alcaniphilus TaxID=1166482 RepID=UPI00140DA26C|nr:EAL domain-containing protein [Pseudomaricurvus alcaniphilus]NHN38667.1 EAL domain-containing protein [Pseudomaricurvus alcaniphilus]